MKKGLIICCLLLVTVMWNSYAETNLMFEKANQQYHNKNYDSAVHLYQEMIDDGYAHSDLFYNAGNAYFRINKIGMAIWCYQNALNRHYEKNYAENLLLAQKRIKNPIASPREIFFIRWWKGWLGLFTVNQWSIIALVTFLLGMTLLFVRIIKSNTSSKWPSRILLSMSILCLLMVAFRYMSGLERKHAIVIASAQNGNPSELSEGIEVIILREQTNTCMVILPDGKKATLATQSLKFL
ncbi:MAG TPA: hypothetical protein PLU10_00260 [Chitinophagaceae bacterium]|nr:hypothetical protein [Chitinophagaceae bacterium]